MGSCGSTEMRARWCFGLAAVLSTASGCTETMRHHVDDGFRATHADIRGVDIDVEASEVHLVAHRELDADDAAEVDGGTVDDDSAAPAGGGLTRPVPCRAARSAASCLSRLLSIAAGDGGDERAAS